MNLPMMTAFNQMLITSCAAPSVPPSSTNFLKQICVVALNNFALFQHFFFPSSSSMYFNESQFAVSLFRSTLNFSIQSATHFQGNRYPFIVLPYDYQEHTRQPARWLSYIDNGPRKTWSGLPSRRPGTIARTNKDRSVRRNHAERHGKAPQRPSIKQNLYCETRL